MNPSFSKLKPYNSISGVFKRRFLRRVVQQLNSDAVCLSTTALYSRDRENGRGVLLFVVAKKTAEYGLHFIQFNSQINTEYCKIRAGINKIMANERRLRKVCSKSGQHIGVVGVGCLTKCTITVWRWNNSAKYYFIILCVLNTNLRSWFCSWFFSFVFYNSTYRIFISQHL